MTRSRTSHSSATDPHAGDNWRVTIALPQRMTDKPDIPLPLTLRRWSQRKLAATRKESAEPPPMLSPQVGAADRTPAAVSETSSQRAPLPPSQTHPSPVPPSTQLGTQLPAGSTAQLSAQLPSQTPTQLPSLESLTFDSDFSAFMQPSVDETTKRAALRKLFSDPSFNVMDGLDIYVGDYTQSDPMPVGMLEKLSAVYAMLDPPPDDKEAVGEPVAARADTAVEGLEPAPVPEITTPTTETISSDAQNAVPVSVSADAVRVSQRSPDERR